jgi:glycosyltransferase involved in cell wall biosynthesis
MPKVLVLIRCRNSAPGIARTLRSALDQTAADVRVLVADDASTDGTVDRIRSVDDSRITLMEHRSIAGAARCLNQLLECSDSPYVVTVPDDAVLLPGALSTMIDALEESPRTGAVYAGAFPVNPDGSATRDRVRRQAARHARWTARPDRVDYLLAFGDQGLGPIAYRRSALDDIGQFDMRGDGEATLSALFRIARRHDLQTVGLVCARGRGSSRASPSLLRRLRAYHRAVSAGSGGSTSAASAGLRVLGARAIEAARSSASHCRQTARAFLTERVLGPLGERFYRRALSRGSRWSPSVMDRPRRSRPMPTAIAYYLWRYPVFSETFIARELIALEAAGVDVRVIADGADYGPRAGVDHLRPVQRTEYLEPVPRRQALWDMACVVASHPLRTVRLFAHVVSSVYQTPKRFRNDAYVFVKAARLARVLRARGVEHLHAPWGNATAFVAMIAARLAGIEYSVQFRAHEIHRRTAAFLLPEKIRGARFAVTNSRFNQAHLQGLVAPEDRAKIHQIYNGLDLDRFDIARPPAAPAADLTILSVARLIEAKGLPYLFEACRALHDRGYRFRCEIIGAPELPLYVNDYVEIVSLHRRLGIADYVELLGPLPFPRVLEHYARADIFALPCVVARDGSNDITPNSLLEAMAMGLPVVSTTITAIPELVTDGISGLLVAPKDPAALAGAIARLIDDPELRRRLGETAREQSRGRFDVRANIQRYVDLFRAS